MPNSDIRPFPPPSAGALDLPDVAVPPPPETTTADLVGYARAIWERRLVVIAVFAATVTAATIYCLTATPVYEARAQLLIEPEAPNVVAFKEVLQEQTGKTDYYLTQFQILRSRTLAQMTLERLGAWEHPEFKADADRFARLRHIIGGSFKVRPETTDASAKVDPQYTVAHLQAIGRFLQRLTIEPIRNSRLVNVRFRSADPRLAADALNTLVRLYIERSMELKYVASKEALSWLDTQLVQQRKEVAGQERVLQQFRDQNDLALEGRDNVMVQRLGDLSTASTRARTERIQKESLYDQLKAGDVTDMAFLSAVAPVGALEELRTQLTTLQHRQTQLEAQLGDKHPDLVAARAAVSDMQARLRAELDRYRASVLQEVQAARANERRLTEAFETQKAQALSRDRRAIEYDALQREAASSREVLQSLLQRAKEMAVAGDLKTSNIRVIDSASVPLSTAYPRKQVVLGVAAFVGLALGVVAALLLAFTDTRIKSPDQVRRQLDLPFLGFAPLLPRNALQGGAHLMNNGVPSDFAEALRSVRTNVVLHRARGGPQVLLVTSTHRGEGKTVIATNLATALAQARQRVLLIDGDLRRPQLHRAFNQGRAPGLADVLRDQALATDAVRESDVDGLKLLPAGTPTVSPADLLGFNPIEQIIGIVGEAFDWIVIDSPPVGEVTDACLFASGTARVLFVVAGDRVRRSDAKAAVDRLLAADASFAGAVLSRVNDSSDRYYRASA